MSPRRVIALAVAGVVGLALAVGVTMAATSLTSQRIGLDSEPLTAGQKLAPPLRTTAAISPARPRRVRHKPERRHRRRHRSTPAAAPPVAPAPVVTTSPPPVVPPAAAVKPAATPAQQRTTTSQHRGRDGHDGGDDNSDNNDNNSDDGDD